jgi:hypothetical protein
MNDKIDKILRALAKTGEGPFRVIAYGVAKAAGPEASRISRNLRELAREIASDAEPTLVIEDADPFSPMPDRVGFRRRVLPLVRSTLKDGSKGGDPTAPLTGRGAPERARERLADVAAALPRLLEDVDRLLAGSGPADGPSTIGATALHAPAPGTGPGVAGAPVPPQPPSAPAPSEVRGRIPLFLARSFEDLGPDVGIVAQSIEVLLERGAHVVLHDEHLDTRTREGRLVARTALRLGAIKAERARERSNTELARRREALHVYGPIPFGFRREGQDLLPLQDQMEAVRRARELSRLAQTPVMIALMLNRENRTWKDGSRFTWRRVAQVLRNPIYERVLSEASA